jgi:HPt (histidine-containing phosphotransfer) domain-containing protein
MADKVINMQIVNELLELCEDGDTELLVDLIDMFLSDGPAKLRGVRDGLAAGDFEQVERAAHSLKGSAGNLGAVKLQDVSEAIQLASNAKAVSPLPQLATELEQTYREAEVELRRLRERFAGSLGAG